MSTALDAREAAADGRPEPAQRLRSKHLLSAGDLSREEILLILDSAEAMKEVGTRRIKKVPTLRGATVVNLFLEPSTRTRTSFEIAEKRLSADTLNIAGGTSSLLKGETLVDTARTLEAMAPDMVVLRHAASGACHLFAGVCDARVINAGDGMHEHPTQALLDAFTIREHKPRFEGLKVVIVGDLLHSPGVAFQHPAADRARRRRVGLRSPDADAARGRALRSAGDDVARRGAGERRRGDAAAGAGGADARAFLSLPTRVLRHVRTDRGAGCAAPAPT